MQTKLKDAISDDWNKNESTRTSVKPGEQSRKLKGMLHNSNML